MSSLCLRGWHHLSASNLANGRSGKWPVLPFSEHHSIPNELFMREMICLLGKVNRDTMSCSKWASLDQSDAEQRARLDLSGSCGTWSRGGRMIQLTSLGKGLQWGSLMQATDWPGCAALESRKAEMGRWKVIWWQHNFTFKPWKPDSDEDLRVSQVNPVFLTTGKLRLREV